MATITHQIQRIDKFMDDAHVLLWETLTETNDRGSPVEMPGSADRSVQIVGNFGAGGTVVIQGSNILAPVESSDTDWFSLTDPQGNALSKTAAAGEAVLELTRWIRPRVTAGTGVDVDVHLLVKRK